MKRRLKQDTPLYSNTVIIGYEDAGKDWAAYDHTVYVWCDENCKGQWNCGWPTLSPKELLGSKKYYFQYKTDAVAFKLTWSC